MNHYLTGPIWKRTERLSRLSLLSNEAYRGGENTRDLFTLEKHCVCESELLRLSLHRCGYEVGHT